MNIVFMFLAVISCSLVPMCYSVAAVYSPNKWKINRVIIYFWKETNVEGGPLSMPHVPSAYSCFLVSRVSSFIFGYVENNSGKYFSACIMI